MSVASYSTRRLDHLGLVAGMCDHLGLVDEIDRLLPGSGRQVSHGGDEQPFAPARRAVTN